MDDQLRALERAARAAPDDRAAGWALVRGLERAGDEVAAWRELCRLARAGDDAAWEGLAWTPRGAMSFGRRIERRLGTDAVSVVSTGPGEVVLVEGDALLALDPATLTTRWSRPATQYAPSCVTGPYVVRLDGAAFGFSSPSITVSDRHGGGEVTQRSVPSPDGGPVAVVSLAASADLLLLLVRSDGAGGPRWLHLILSLPELGPVHQLDVDAPVLFPVLQRDLVLVCSGPQVVDGSHEPAAWSARALDGSERWREVGALVHLDARGALFLRDRRGIAAAPELHLVDPGGARLWTIEPGGGRPHLGRDHVVLVESYERAGEAVVRLSTRERATGASGWERVLTGPRGARARVDVVGDHVHVLYLGARGEGGAHVEVIDAGSGQTRWVADVPLSGGADGRRRSSLHSVDDGLLLLEQPVGDSPALLHRLGAP